MSDNTMLDLNFLQYEEYDFFGSLEDIGQAATQEGIREMDPSYSNTEELSMTGDIGDFGCQDTQEIILTPDEPTSKKSVAYDSNYLPDVFPLPIRSEVPSKVTPIQVKVCEDDTAVSSQETSSPLMTANNNTKEEMATMLPKCDVVSSLQLKHDVQLKIVLRSLRDLAKHNLGCRHRYERAKKKRINQMGKLEEEIRTICETLNIECNMPQIICEVFRLFYRKKAESFLKECYPSYDKEYFDQVEKTNNCEKVDDRNFWAVSFMVRLGKHLY